MKRGGDVTIHIAAAPTAPTPAQLALAQLAAVAEVRVEEHRRGEHPWGCMRRDCPLCQAGR